MIIKGFTRIKGLDINADARIEIYSSYGELLSMQMRKWIMTCVVIFPFLFFSFLYTYV